MPRIKTGRIWCMVSDDMEVEFMATPIRLLVTAAAVSLASPVWAQDASKSSPPRVVTKTLVASEAQKECLTQQQAAAALQVSRRWTVELQSFAPGRKRDHRLQARRYGKRVRQLHAQEIRRLLPRVDQRRQTLGDSSLRISARFAVNPQRRARGPR